MAAGISFLIFSSTAAARLVQTFSLDSGVTSCTAIIIGQVENINVLGADPENPDIVELLKLNTRVQVVITGAVREGQLVPIVHYRLMDKSIAQESSVELDTIRLRGVNSTIQPADAQPTVKMGNAPSFFEFHPGESYLFFLRDRDDRRYQLMAPEELRMVRIDPQLLSELKRSPLSDNAWERVVAVLETVIAQQPHHMAATLLLHESQAYQKKLWGYDRKK